jgi:hypothetical protein
MNLVDRLGLPVSALIFSLRAIFTNFKLFLWALVPWVGFILLFGGLVSAVGPYIAAADTLVQGFLEGFNSPGWISMVITSLVLVILWIVTITASSFFVYLLAQILLSPFLSFLVEQVMVFDNYPMEEKSLTEQIQLAFKMFGVSIIKLVIFTLVALILFVLSFSGVLAPVTVFAAYLMISFDLSDYCYESLGMGLRERLRFFFENIISYAPFAGILLLLSFIPGTMFFFLPLLIIASTKVTLDLKRRRYA